MSIRISTKTLKSMKAPQSGNRIEWDLEIPGFGARITAAGIISFVLDYRLNGRQRRYTIGRSPELSVVVARLRAGQLRVNLLDGIDPMEERNKSRQEPSLEDLAGEYIEKYAVHRKRASSLRDDRQMIEKIIVPRLGKHRILAVCKQDVETLHQSMKKTPYYANRVLSLLSKMFNLAIEWKWIVENPTRGVPRFQEAKRECSLTADQLLQFEEALDSYSDQNAATALKLLMMTGSRKSEVLKARWEEFDFDRRKWTKPSHNTKQKRVEHIPLSDDVSLILSSIKPDPAVGWLFPGAKGKPRVSLERPWRQICKKAGLVASEQIEGKHGIKTRYVPIFRIHDLRHSYASHLVSNGAPLQVVGKLLGHTQAATTMRYAHLQDEALRDATNLFGRIYSKKAAKKPHPETP